MLILVTGNGSIGGSDMGNHWINRHTGRFLQQLKGQDHVDLVYCDLRTHNKGYLQDFDLNHHNIAFHALRTDTIYQRVRDVLKLFSACMRADFVYIFFPGSLSKVAAGFCRSVGKPYGLYVRGERFEQTFVDRFGVRGARFALTVSPILQLRLSKICRRAGVIRPMTDLRPEYLTVREQLIHPPQPLHLLFVGRIERAKGVFELVKAAKLLQEKGINFRLRLIGSGPDFEELLALKNAIPGGERVDLLGQIDNLETILHEYENADAFVFASHHEGFPRVLLEAMTKSCLVFTTMVGGIPGIMFDDINCFSLPVGDPQGIAETIVRRLQRVDDWNRVRQAGFETTKQVMFERAEHWQMLLEYIDA